MKHLLLIFVFISSTISLFGQQSYLANSMEQFTIQEVDFRVFPNPATEYIQVSDNEVVRQVKVYNLIGRQVKSYAYTSGEKFYVGDLPQGMYLVQLVGSKNAVLATKRINIR